MEHGHQFVVSDVATPEMLPASMSVGVGLAATLLLPPKYDVLYAMNPIVVAVQVAFETDSAPGSGPLAASAPLLLLAVPGLATWLPAHM